MVSSHYRIIFSVVSFTMLIIWVVYNKGLLCIFKIYVKIDGKYSNASLWSGVWFMVHVDHAHVCTFTDTLHWLWYMYTQDQRKRWVQVWHSGPSVDNLGFGCWFNICTALGQVFDLWRSFLAYLVTALVRIKWYSVIFRSSWSIATLVTVVNMAWHYGHC